MGKYKDITGQKFGRLTAISFVENRKHHSYWLFRCDCGREKIIGKGNAAGQTLSCGCYQKEQTSKARATHKSSNTKLYRTWAGMLIRCSYTKGADYHRYGGRGIKVLWGSFEEFKIDMQESYDKHIQIHGKTNTTIERINLDGHYCKDNCRWATQKEQARNRRTSRYLVFNGIRKTLAEWAEVSKLSYGLIQDRLTRDWSIEEAITTPVKRLAKR